jgi:hypothetical protein
LMVRSATPDAIGDNAIGAILVPAEKFRAY